ncbi:AUGMIN subunit 5 [Helianthus annuus]|uniref:AUGMIN subunit 5 n=1 Tax=Helianthus annuus TaxID=4232 RepID=UPI000B8FEB45|nr:AUGMIN subunit 5 [Helianthus annuus]KAJ0564245.1 putative HAUS augmin-like complex subunit 5 [Helianthus annuus]KAJ0729570.1 putative HAUS augmin-like complex subunit 5 [Helianthus annuus]
MQTTVSQPEAITDWLQKEMNYRPLGPHITHSITSIPSPDSIRRVCRGNMIPIFEFLLTRVKSEKTVENIRRNILVHGTGDNAGGGTEGVKGGRDRRVSRGGRKKEKVNLLENNDNREEALQERELAEKEVKRLRCVVRRKRKELNEKMVEVSREEADRKRVVDERANYRHKQVMLEAYGEQCDVAARIFTQYHKHLCSYVNQVKDSQRADADSSVAAITGLHVNNEKGADYSTIKTLKPVDDEVLETNRERNIRKACELLAEQAIKKIRNSFPAYKGYSIHSNPQVEASKLSIDFNGDIPHEIQHVILDCLKSPPQLLLAITAYTQRLKLVVVKEIEKTDARADADILRYKYENNRLIDASPDLGSQFPLQLYGNGNNGLDMPSKGTQYQRLERQKAHVKQFVATEDQLNKAAEARKACQKLLKRLTGSSDVGPPFFSQHVSSLRELELEVWAMEREAAGLKASLTTLTCEVQRLNMLRLERKEVEDSLNKKWKKIEEFDARRLELKSVYDALIKAITDTTAFWSQKPLSAMEDASKTIIPACTRVADIANRTKDLIHKEVSAFSCVPDNRLYMLPSTPQALLESLNPNSCTGPEQVSVTEKNADLLTARAGSGDPSAIPSICRVASALQYPAGSEGSEASLASVLESMEFCLKSRGSEASVLEELSKAINFVHTGRDLVESGRSLLDHAYHFQKEYNTSTSYCLDLASEQDGIIMNQWLPDLKKSIESGEKSLNDCKYIEGLLDEWWEQPASTLVDWVTLDDQNVVAWQNHVKQLLAAYDKELF